MKRSLTIAIQLGVCTVMSVLPSVAQDNVKLAQTGMQFLSVVSDAQAAGMARAMTTIPMRSASVFFNPACMADGDYVFDLSASYNQWIADINHGQFSLSYRPLHGDIGVFALSAQFVNYGEVLGTRVANNLIGYEDTGIIKPTALALGVGYAKALSEVFAVGIHVRYVRQTLGESVITTAGGSETRKNEASVVSFDFGTQFKTGLKSLAFGMSVRNFSKEISFQDESFSLPLVFTIGVSMDVMDLFNDRDVLNSVLVSIDAVHNRDYREQLYIGAEAAIFDALALRGGYITGSDEEGATMGVGVQRFGIRADYSYTPFGVFDKVQRFTVRYSL